MLNIEHGNAICYSGFRSGQSPHSGMFPSYEEVREDLLILRRNWKYLRLYDCDKQTELVLEVIQQEQLDFKILLGAYIGAELNNLDCPWGGAYSEDELVENAEQNLSRIQTLIRLANQYPDSICALSVGNEATVQWTDHLVPVGKVIEYVRLVKNGAEQPVTFCENYLPWLDKLKDLVKEVDFISIHTYPVWEYKKMDEALEYTQLNYKSVADTYPDKPIVITEAGWATKTNGRGILPENVSEDLQAAYYAELLKWTNEERILAYVFEAFDESWKGSDDLLEPEKHWGLFYENRTPKKVMTELYAHLLKK